MISRVGNLLKKLSIKKNLNLINRFGVSSTLDLIKIKEQNHFPIENIPFGVFKHNTQSEKRIGVAIGEYILDLKESVDSGLFSSSLRKEV